MPAQISGTASASFLALSQGATATARSSSSRTAPPAADTARLNGGRARLASAQSAVHQNQTRLEQGKRKAKMLARVDRLVEGMEALAKRMASNQGNKTQQSMMVTRFNDLQRQVNKLDGIEVSEGRGERGQESVTRAVVANQKKVDFAVGNRQEAEAALPEIRAFRGQIRKERTAAATEETTARRDIAQALARFEPADREPVRADTVEKAQEGIKAEGTRVVGNQPDSETVVNLLA